MSKHQIYFRYIREPDLSIEILNNDGELVVLIRQPDKAPIREVLNIKIDGKGVQNNISHLSIDVT